jgi:TRAP-type C4-dicarboxylate transport system permease small subunit
MNIAFLRDKLPLRTRLTVEIFSEILIVLFALTVMIVGGYKGALKQMIQLDSALQIPVGIIYAVIPVSGILIVFYFIYNVSRLAKQFAAGDGSREGA